MPVKVSTTISKIELLSNSVNSSLISDLYDYMKKNGLSESHINNTLKTNMLFSEFLGENVSFYDVQRKDQIINFLDSKMKNAEIDPDKKWITTWYRTVRFFWRKDIRYFRYQKIN
jgi:integrase/recombinase XerD